jgi:hypothetical protein
MAAWVSLLVCGWAPMNLKVIDMDTPDVMTSSLSTFPYDYQTMQNMINVTRTAKGMPEYHSTTSTRVTDPITQRQTRGLNTLSLGPVSMRHAFNFLITYRLSFTARLLSFFGQPNEEIATLVIDSRIFLARWRFLYFHGQKHARLSKDQTVYDKPMHGRTLLITLFSPFLLLGPELYMRQMESLWDDATTLSTEWRAFVRNSLDEWKDLILTVRYPGLSLAVPERKPDMTTTVDSDAFGQCRLSCGSWSSPFQS